MLEAGYAGWEAAVTVLICDSFIVNDRRLHGFWNLITRLSFNDHGALLAQSSLIGDSCLKDSSTS